MNLLSFAYFLGNLFNVIPSLGYLLVDILGVYAALDEDESSALYLTLALLFLVDSLFYWWAFELSLPEQDYPRLHPISWVGRSAEALNVVGSIGYVVAAVIPYQSTGLDAWQRIQVYQLISMVVFVVDSLLYYLHALLMKYCPGNGQEGETFYPKSRSRLLVRRWRWYYALNLSKETADIYFWTNLTNILGSFAYLAATIVGLDIYFDLKGACGGHDPADAQKCYHTLQELYGSAEVKSIRLVASHGDVLFFVSAFLLMLAWYHEWAESDLTPPEEEEEDLLEDPGIVAVEKYTRLDTRSFDSMKQPLLDSAEVHEDEMRP
ncbi:hypothetical protein QOT17_003481 [Balamuthia mandrillaris]